MNNDQPTDDNLSYPFTRKWADHLHAEYAHLQKVEGEGLATRMLLWHCYAELREEMRMQLAHIAKAAGVELDTNAEAYAEGFAEVFTKKMMESGQDGDSIHKAAHMAGMVAKAKAMTGGQGKLRVKLPGVVGNSVEN